MLRQWEEAYLRQALEEEIELAGVHPQYRVRRYAMPSVISAVASIFPAPSRHTHASQHSRTTITPPLPHWRRSWNAAGSLVAEMGLSVRIDLEEGTVSVGNGSRRRDVTESYADHPSKDAAIFAAIVRAAIRVCTEAREGY
jgi:hypothetical protein